MTPNIRVNGLIAGLLLVSLLLSCQHERRRYIIPEKKFVDVLVDLHLAEAIGRKLSDPELAYRPDSASLYGAVFSKHNVNMAMFDSTMSYYSKRPEKFQKVYNATTAKLKHMEAEVIEAKNNESKQEAVHVVWSDPKVYHFPPLQGNRLEISVPLQGTGVYTVSAIVTRSSEDLSVDPRMTLYFSRNEEGSGKRIPFEEIRFTSREGKPITYRAVKQLEDPEYKFLKGYIIDYSNPDTLFTRSVKVRAIMVTMKKGTAEYELNK